MEKEFTGRKYCEEEGLNCTSILEIIVFSSSSLRRSCGERIFKYEKNRTTQ
jgi:hypothetical protein